VSCNFSGLMLATIESWIGIASIRVTTPGVGLPASCILVSLGSWILSRLLYDSRSDARRRFASIVSCGFPRLMYALCEILNRRHDDKRCDSRRRCASVFYCAFAKLMYAVYGILCRRLDSRCRFVSIVSYVFSMLLTDWFGIEVCVAHGRCRNAQRRFDNVVS
jgi:hypothetical protein